MNPRGLVQVSRILCCLMLVVAILFAAGGGYAYVRAHRFVARAVTTAGTILELVPSAGPNGQTIYTPVYTYRDRSGATHKVRASFSSHPAAFDVGESVTVLYDPANADDGRIRSFFGLWGLCLILWGIAGMMGINAGALVLLAPFVIRRIWPAAWAETTP